MTLEITAQARERLFGIWLHIEENASEERADKVEDVCSNVLRNCSNSLGKDRLSGSWPA